MKKEKVKVYKKRVIVQTKLGTILREAREKKDLTKITVAKMFGVTHANIFYIESGRIKCPNAKLLYNLSVLYKLKIKDLILMIED
ncbi:MAG TPA: helix-turn-helix transcriptional regulator [Saprospiraceae bacterium]|nr:helix-turn-helix transcriptional regulator [Saprospiraceae bacterium]